MPRDCVQGVAADSNATETMQQDNYSLHLNDWATASALICFLFLFQAVCHA
jgi:hypothetical protein